MLHLFDRFLPPLFGEILVAPIIEQPVAWILLWVAGSAAAARRAAGQGFIHDLADRARTTAALGATAVQRRRLALSLPASLRQGKIKRSLK
jgi:hypothetical protein